MPSDKAVDVLVQSGKLQLEDIGDAAAAQPKSTLDSKPGAIALAAAVRILTATQTRVSILGTLRAARFSEGGPTSDAERPQRKQTAYPWRPTPPLP